MRGIFSLFALGLLARGLAFPSTMRQRRVDDRMLIDLAERGEPSMHNTTYYFDQLIDHNDASLGTFKQRYWFNPSYYKAGGPVLLLINGEQSADGQWVNLNSESSIAGKLAESLSGIGILFEHRFFGLSNPYPDLTEESLQYLTIQQNIDDMVYFAQNVVLPIPGGDSISPQHNPWILVGGSYPGAVVSWAVNQRPDIFYAGYSSSGVVQAIEDFWHYFEPERINMPQNCSNDIQAVIAHIDGIAAQGDETAINNVKEIFGFGNVTYFDDFAAILTVPLGKWQKLQRGYPVQEFFDFCDFLEVNSQNETAPATGWGLEHALKAYGAYMQLMFDDEPPSDAIVGSHDIPANISVEIDNYERSWDWMCCNEVGWYQTGAPEGHRSVASRFNDVERFKRDSCLNQFPQTFHDMHSPAINATNAKYGGWDVHPPRVIFVNGKNDPWLDATVSSSLTVYESTALTPVYLGDGIHCSDMYTNEAAVDEAITYIQDQAVMHMHKWVSEWTPFAWNATLA